jgi:hypothetical protein
MQPTRLRAASRCRPPTPTPDGARWRRAAPNGCSDAAAVVGDHGRAARTESSCASPAFGGLLSVAMNIASPVMSIAATAPSRAAAGAVAQCGTAAACDLWHARREHGGTQRHAHAHAHTDGWLATEALTCDAVRVRVEDRADGHAVLRVPHNDHRVLALCTLAPSASTHQPKVGSAEYG